MKSKIIQILTSNNYDGYQPFSFILSQKFIHILRINDETDLKA
jgi:hypothetical protein